MNQENTYYGAGHRYEDVSISLKDYDNKNVGVSFKILDAEGTMKIILEKTGDGRCVGYYDNPLFSIMSDIESLPGDGKGNGIGYDYESL